MITKAKKNTLHDTHIYSPESKILIIDSGVDGTALADELMKRGAKDATVIDPGILNKTGGSSFHAPGVDDA